MASAMPQLPDASTGSFTMDVDARSGRITVIGTGYWTSSYIAEHFRHVADLVRAHRAAGIPIRVLVDLRQSDVQSQETVEHMGRSTAQIYAEGDRVALLVSSSLARIQMRRAANISIREFFASLDEAEAWLAA